MDWSGDGRWTGTHAARQAEPGHGTAVATVVLGSGTSVAGVAVQVQGANRGVALLGLTLDGYGGSGGGGRLLEL